MPDHKISMAMKLKCNAKPGPATIVLHKFVVKGHSVRSELAEVLSLPMVRGSPDPELGVAPNDAFFSFGVCSFARDRVARPCSRPALLISGLLDRSLIQHRTTQMKSPAMTKVDSHK